MYNMNQESKGDVTVKFMLPDKKINRNIIEQAINESSKNVTITDEEKEKLLRYEESVKCK
jgi:hypothetical protein